MHPACKFEGEERMTGDLVLDGLLEVFPQVNFSTLIEVSISFKDDIDGAADYIVHNVLPNINPDGNDSNTNGDLYIYGHQQVSDDASAHLVIAPVVNDTLSKSSQFVMANKNLAENEDSPMEVQLMQSPVAASTSGHSCLPEESNSDYLIAGVQNSLVHDEVTQLGNQQKVMHFSDHLIGGHDDERMQCSSFEKNTGMSDSEDNLMLHDDGSTDTTIGPINDVKIEALDDAIATENYKMHALMSNVAAISEMLEDVELNEAKTKHVVSEASQAGHDILLEAEKLKEMCTLAEEENSKVAGEVSAEKSILASEAQGLQSRLFNISEERNNFVLIIDEMHQTLQRRLDLAEAERAAAETNKIERETMAQEMLKEQEVLLDAAKNESKKLEQQAQENAQLRELLMDRGYVVDELHGEMLGIFENIAQLQYRVDMQLPANGPRQLASSSMSSSVESSAYKLLVDKPLQLTSSSLPCSVKSAPSKQIPADEPLELASSSLSSSVKSATSKQIPADEPVQLASSSLYSSVKSAPSKLVPVDEPLQLASSRLSSSVGSATSESSGSSATESNSSLIADASSHSNFALDDSWDVVEEDEQCLC